MESSSEADKNHTLLIRSSLSEIVHLARENQQEELIKLCIFTLTRELARRGLPGPCKVNQKEMIYLYVAKRHEEPINKCLAKS